MLLTRVILIVQLTMDELNYLSIIVYYIPNLTKILPVLDNQFMFLHSTLGF